MKRCSRCKEEKSLTQFTKNRTCKDGYGHYCKPCRKILSAEYHQRKYKKVSDRKRQHRLDNLDLYRKREFRSKVRAWASPEEADRLTELWYEGNRLCEICGVHEDDLDRRLCADHDHQTLQFRGFLCSSCNSGLGMFKDGKTALKRAIQYLDDHGGGASEDDQSTQNDRL